MMILWRRWWQGVVFAAAVSFAQLHDDATVDVRSVDRYPYVRMVDLADLSARERIGSAVLTTTYSATGRFSPN